MRIDPNSQSPEPVQPDSVQDPKNPASQKAEQDANAAGGVQVQLSTSAGQVAALTLQALNAPAVRTDRVDALRQAVRNGDYNATNEQVAAAMYSDMSASGANE